ncbi:MAG: tRNA pseudouridine(13) synthase TruD [archaeon]|jgi:tRNA pseudouridine13 synthase
MDFKYITTTKPINGRIKQFCADFIVEEIGRDYVTHLTYLPDKKVPETDWDAVFEKKEDNDQLLVDVEKFNLSTTTAINDISRFLRTSRKRIGYAGLKDKRAITVQRLSIFEPQKERISKFYFKYIKLYNPVWSKTRIDIGDLRQNKFTITVRRIPNHTIEELQTLFADFKKQIGTTGLINYFGEQRFGGARDITHKVGKLILQNNYKEAILSYLTEDCEMESPELREARKQLREDLNFGKHAYDFPSGAGYERLMLNYLANNPDDYLGVFKTLPKAIQYLFVHAYQSYLYNQIITRRIEKGFGTAQIEGDTILNGEVMIPLFGFSSKVNEGEAGRIEQEILDKEGVTLEMFYNNDHSVFSSKGDHRPIRIPVFNLDLLEIADDDNERNKEENPNFKKLTLSFTLDKGNYATNLARELIKPTDDKWC